MQIKRIVIIAGWDLAGQREPYCPGCGTLRCYSMSRGRFKCSEKECNLVFTVTSGTVFAFRKLSFKKMVIAIWLSVNSVKGKAALQLSREIGVQFKTAWVLLMKLREAIASRRDTMMLQGVIEIDGKYVGGHIRPKTGPRIASTVARPSMRTTSGCANSHCANEALDGLAIPSRASSATRTATLHGPPPGIVLCGPPRSSPTNTRVMTISLA